ARAATNHFRVNGTSGWYYTNRKMTRNISLYQQLGFAIDHEEVKDDGRTIVHMSRSIAAIDR
ncbi:hypothetical protein, partial [Acidiphilium rubrum]|uniref:hypothetical protein n=2 Tax=Acidiphilium TaxID=522 RepID=UPI002B71EF18